MPDELKPEYDLKNLNVRRLGPRRKGFTDVVRLKPDVAELFPDADSVNEALRFLIGISKKRSRLTRSKQRNVDSSLPSRSKGTYPVLAKRRQHSTQARRGGESTRC